MPCMVTEKCVPLNANDVEQPSGTIDIEFNEREIIEFIHYRIDGTLFWAIA